MLKIWDMVEALLLFTAPPSASPIFPVRLLITPGFVQIIITDNCYWIRIKVRNFSKNIQEAKSREKLTTKLFSMFSRYEIEYIIAYIKEDSSVLSSPIFHNKRTSYL